MAGRLVQINVSSGGVPKCPVPAAHVGLLGLEGDAHRDPVRHGGPERALCLFALERIEALQAEGHPVEPGTLGENLTVAGLDWARIGTADRLRVGPHVIVEVTTFTAPCVNVRSAFLDGDSSRISEKRHPGWSRVYARVMVPGEIRVGDPVTRLERRAPIEAAVDGPAPRHAAAAAGPPRG